MIELILATLNNILARLLDAVISWWGKELMPLSMAEMTKKIPFLATGYRVSSTQGNGAVTRRYCMGSISATPLAKQIAKQKGISLGKVSMYYYGTAGPADGLYNSILIQRTQGSQVYYLYGNTFCRQLFC